MAEKNWMGHATFTRTSTNLGVQLSVITAIELLDNTTECESWELSEKFHIFGLEDVSSYVSNIGDNQLSPCQHLRKMRQLFWSR